MLKTVPEASWQAKLLRRSQVRSCSSHALCRCMSRSLKSRQLSIARAVLRVVILHEPEVRRKLPPLQAPKSTAVFVCRPGVSKALTLEVSTGLTITQLKLQLRGSFEIAETVEMLHLVYGGNVLRGDTRLSELVCHDQLVFWLLPHSGELLSQNSALAHAALSLGIFQFPTAIRALNCHQGSKLVAGCVDLLNGFMDSTSPWHPSLKERVAIQAALHSFVTERPAFESAPYITWFGKYGCALLSSVPQVGLVQLRLVCLDAWSFQVHATEEEGKRIARANNDGAAVCHVGHVPLEDFGQLM
eukprot:3495538-Pleurochrysis_carterae.AAC.2